MVDVNEKEEAPKLNSIPEKDVDQSDIAPAAILSKMEGEEVAVEDDDEEYEEEEEEDEDEEEDEVPEEEGEEEKVNDDGRAMAVVNDGGLNTDAENNKGKAIDKEETNKKIDVKEDEKKAGQPENGEELGENVKRKGKKPRPSSRIRKKAAQKADGDKPESSSKKNASKRVESMGMVFMCTSKTKTDCFRYKILGLPANKKDQVAKIYKGMRLFLFDVDLRLMYGIFKAAGPGGYNLEPKAFKSDFPSQVRFTVLDDCLPVAEENFRDVLKENYYTRNKFEGLLKAEQVKKLCKLFVGTGKGVPRPKAALKRRRTEPVESRRTRVDEIRRTRVDESRRSRADDRDRKKRKRRPREEERRPHSPPGREKRRYTDYERPPVLYEREVPAPRFLPLPPPAATSPMRSYGYERPLDIHPYVRDRVPEHRTYRVLDVEPRHHDEILSRDRDRDPYHIYSREAPPYRDTVYPLPPEYHLVSRDYHLPAVVEPPEYRLPGGSRVPSYRDVGLAADYRSSAAALPEYRSQRTHYRY